MPGAGTRVESKDCLGTDPTNGQGCLGTCLGMAGNCGTLPSLGDMLRGLAGAVCLLVVH